MSEKIILIDDDNNILTSVSVALKAEGWVIETYNAVSYTHLTLPTNGEV